MDCVPGCCASRIACERVLSLLRAGASPNDSSPDVPYWKPLEAAIEEMESGGSIDAVRALIEGGADVNAPGDHPKIISRIHPIHCAVFNGNLTAAKLLLENGADPNVPTGDGNTALKWAAENGNVEMAQLLIQFGAKKNIDYFGGPGGVNALNLAVGNLDISMIATLLDAGADPSILDADSRPPWAYLPKRDKQNLAKWKEAAALLYRHRK